MGKGEAWINGQSIGRYWVSFKTPEGSPSQTWFETCIQYLLTNITCLIICDKQKFWSMFNRYNVPRSFLKQTGNLLVLFEEENANPLGISLDTISIDKVCAHVSDVHPPSVNSWKAREHYRLRPRPRVHLRCPGKRIISKIVFASHGNPSGNCENYSVGKCHSSNSQQIVEKAS